MNTGLIEKAQKQEIIGLTHINVLLSQDGKSKTVDANPVIRVKEPPKPDYTVDRVTRDAERAAGVERDEFGFVKLQAGTMPAGPQPGGIQTFPDYEIRDDYFACNCFVGFLQQSSIFCTKRRL